MSKVERRVSLLKPPTAIESQKRQDTASLKIRIDEKFRTDLRGMFDELILPTPAELREIELYDQAYDGAVRLPSEIRKLTQP